MIWVVETNYGTEAVFDTSEQAYECMKDYIKYMVHSELDKECEEELNNLAGEYRIDSSAFGTDHIWAKSFILNKENFYN